MVALISLLLACGGGDGSRDGNQSDLPCLERDPIVTIGTGAYEWEDLAAGDGLVMVHGPQGGWHMLGSVHVTSTEPIVEVRYTIEAAGAALISENFYRVALVPDGDCAGYYTGMYGYLDVSALAEGDADTPPELLAYETLTLRMEVEDAAGRSGATATEVVAQPDPADL